MAVAEDGRRAVTHFRRLERWLAADLLEARLETGRTHQIRVHLGHIGHPVIGDEVYGGGGARGISGEGRGWARELERRVPQPAVPVEPRNGGVTAIQAEDRFKPFDLLDRQIDDPPRLCPIRMEQPDRSARASRP